MGMLANVGTTPGPDIAPDAAADRRAELDVVTLDEFAAMSTQQRMANSDQWAMGFSVLPPSAHS
jgi:hypothetical protein